MGALIRELVKQELLHALRRKRMQGSKDGEVETRILKSPWAEMQAHGGKNGNTKATHSVPAKLMHMILLCMFE